MTEGSDWQRRALAAERTAGILKLKVRELSGSGPSGVVHRSLERARRREARNQRRAELAQVRSEALEKYSHHLEDEVAARTRSIQLILDNIAFGFMLIGPDLRVRDGFSRACNDLFKTQVRVGDRLTQLLGLTGTSQVEAFSAAVDQIFADILPVELSLQQLPSRHAVGGAALRLEGSLVRSEDGKPEALLLSVEDVTALEAAQADNHHRDVLIAILRQRHTFEEFVSHTLATLDSSQPLPDAGQLRRLVHTVKANAASWGLSEVVAAAHEVEGAGELSSASVTSIADALRKFLVENETILQLGRDRYSYRAPEPAQTGGTSDGHETRNAWRPARELLPPLERLVSEVAQRLGKQVRLAVHGLETRVAAAAMQPVLRTLPHLLNNALDHGIEAPEARGNKPSWATLRVALEETAEAWLLSVEDDGRGVQTEVLRAHALARLSREGDLGSDAPVDSLELPFLDGVSTATTPSDISGRGLGLSAVREAVTQRGGTIALRSSEAGTRIEMVIPKEPAT